MARYYAIAINIEGRHCKGEWTLLQGGRLHVRAPGWGVDTVEIGMGEPVSAAQLALQRIIVAYERQQNAERERQERELAKLRKPHRTKRQPPSDEGPAA